MADAAFAAPGSILIIRRDNIGDLVCTTPLFRALRARYPRARIAALVNTYNRPVLAGNPDIDEIHAYGKAKHRASGASVAGIYWDRIRLFARLRRERFDLVILANPAFHSRVLAMARIIHPRHILGFVNPGQTLPRGLDLAVARRNGESLHEVEEVFRVIEPLGIEGPPPPLRVVPDPGEVARAKQGAEESLSGGRRGHLRIGIHISARKESQRWPAGRFAELMKRLHRERGASFILFWSPGDESRPAHPGDDAKAREIADGVRDVPLYMHPTHELGQLIAGLSLCDAVICSDGGAMHIAAALGKPILCFFGRSSATRWRPWGAPYVLLQPESREVGDVSVEEACSGFRALVRKATL